MHIHLRIKQLLLGAPAELRPGVASWHSPPLVTPSEAQLQVSPPQRLSWAEQRD